MLALTDLVKGSLQAFDVDAVRRLSRGEEADGVVRGSLDAKLLAGSTGVLALAVTAWVMYDAGTTWLVIASGAGALAASLSASLLVRYQASLALQRVSGRIGAASIAGAVLAALAAWTTESAAATIIAAAVGDALPLVVVWHEHRWSRPGWRDATAVIGRCRELLLMQFAYISQFRVGTIALAAAGTPVAVGEYGIASRLAEGFIIIAGALTASSLPMIGAAHARNDSAGLAAIFERSYGAVLALLAPIVGILGLTAPIWIDVLCPRYPGVGPPFVIVGVAVMILFGSSQTTALLNATHRDRAASQSAVLGLVASSVALFWLVPLGAVGVAWARVAGELTRLVIESAAVIRDLGIRTTVVVRAWLTVAPAVAGLAVVVAWRWQTPYVWIAAAAVLAGSAGLRQFWRRPAPDDLAQSDTNLSRVTRHAGDGGDEDRRRRDGQGDRAL